MKATSEELAIFVSVVESGSDLPPRLDTTLS